MPALTEPTFDVSRYLALAECTLTARQFLIWKLTHLQGWTAYQIREAHSIPAMTIQRERERALRLMEAAVLEDAQGTRPFRLTIVCGGNAKTIDDATPLGKTFKSSFPQQEGPPEDSSGGAGRRAA